MSVSSSRAVSISTGTGRAACTRRQTSRPSKPGSMMSRISRSGCQASAVSTAARTVARCLHEESLGAQAGRDGVDDRRIVLDDQDPALCARRGRAVPLWEVCVCSIARP